MSSALSRAREEAMRGGGGDWLDNDTLIANQLVFHITDVKDDRGGGFNGQDRWLVRVEPFYESEEDPDGLISLTDNPARRKFMQVLDRELDELNNKGEDPVIGPCVMVRLKGKNYRYIEIVDWDDERKQPILPQGAVPAGQRVEEDMRPPRRPRSGDGSSSEAAPQQNQSEEPSRPFAGAVEAKAEAAPATRSTARKPRGTKKQEPDPPTAATATPTSPRAQSVRDDAPPAPNAEAPGATTSEADTPASPGTTDEFPPVKVWAKKNGFTVPPGRGRVSNEIKAAYAAAKAMHDLSRPAPTNAGAQPFAPTGPADRPYQGSTREVDEELARRAAENAQATPAEVPASAPSRAPSARHHEAPRAQEVRFRAGMSGTSIEACPACEKHIHDRIFPTGEPGSQQYALVHARCEAGGEQKMMAAVPDPEPDPE